MQSSAKRPSAYAVGLFFSLGHSTVVVAATIAVAVAATAMWGEIGAFQEIGAAIGGAVSTLFLLYISLANLSAFKRARRALARARRGEHADAEEARAAHGVVARLVRPLLNMVSNAWTMYPIGFLFGLGFDTASEIALLAIAAGQAVQGISFDSIIIFPALFTAGMSLMDTLEASLWSAPMVGRLNDLNARFGITLW